MQWLIFSEKRSMKTLISGALICLVSMFMTSEASAQALSKEQCISSVKARTFRLDSGQVEKLCAENPYPVVNCVITKVQGSNSTEKMDEFAKSCTLETIPRRYRKKLEEKPAAADAPVPSVIVPVKELTTPPAEDAVFEEI